MIPKGSQQPEQVFHRPARQITRRGHDHLIDAIKIAEDVLPADIALPEANLRTVIDKRPDDGIASVFDRLPQALDGV